MRLSWVLCFAILIGPVCPAARADVESPKLMKFHDPVDKAVSAGLEWLAKNQRKDGTYPGQYGQTSAIVGLAGMAFLSKVCTPGRGPYGDEINKCLDYVLAHQAPNGSLDATPDGGGMYSHGIATLFLCECSGMVDRERQKKMNQVLPKALKLILTAQQIPKAPEHKGGWRYDPTRADSDISISGWCLMALRSARLNGAPVPKAAIDDAVAYVLKMRDPHSGGFGYSGPGSPPSTARTGVALLCLELTGHHDDEITRKAGDFILNSSFVNDPFRAYATYYCAQGMFQLGGEYWEKFAEQLYTHVLASQHQDGHWEGEQYGPAYGTVMNLLALTVSYRQLPIYQR